MSRFVRKESERSLFLCKDSLGRIAMVILLFNKARSSSRGVEQTVVTLRSKLQEFYTLLKWNFAVETYCPPNKRLMIREV